MDSLPLSASGLAVLADLNTTARRTALMGNSSLWDAFVLCPGLHLQQRTDKLNEGEYPATAALTTGYVFRVENPATVAYMQKVGQTGALTELSVEPAKVPKGAAMGDRESNLMQFDLLDITLSVIPVLLTLCILTSFAVSGQWWALSAVLDLIIARFINIVVIQRRCKVNWHGKSEPGVRGDLLVLLSQDRWFRLHGSVDDLKAVTSGQWMREASFLESSLTSVATLLVYINVSVSSNASTYCQVLLLVLLLVSAGCLAISNESQTYFRMHGRHIYAKGKARSYARRLDLVKDLIEETGRDDWAIQLGMIRSKSNEKDQLADGSMQVLL